MVDYRQIVTIEPGKRGGKPCIRGMRMTVDDVPGWLAVDTTMDEIISDFPELTKDDLYTSLAFATVA